MNLKLLIPTAFAILFSILLVGQGITGMVTKSESCCFPPNCVAENLCGSAKAAKSQIDTDLSNNMYMGFIILLSTLAIYSISRIERKA